MKRLMVVAGDVTRDMFMCPVAPDPDRPWRRSAAWADAVMRGGAWLMEELARERWGDACVVGPAARRADGTEWAVLQSRARLIRDGAPDRYVIDDRLGFLEPAEGALDVVDALDWPERGPSRPVDVLILMHLGLGFSTRARALWERLLRDRPRVVLNTALRSSEEDQHWWDDPLARTLLREHGERLTVVVDAETLRAQRDVDISRHLSWEHSAQDLLVELGSAEALVRLSAASTVVVKFGSDGVVVVQGDRAHLVLDPERLEGDFAAEGRTQNHHSTPVWGLQSALATGLAGERGRELPVEAALRGLAAARCLVSCGLRWSAEERTLSRRKPELACPACRVEVFRMVPVPSPDAGRQLSPTVDGRPLESPVGWQILRHLTTGRVGYAAEEFVIKAESSLLDAVPRGRFGRLLTFDRTEIEALNATANILREYLSRPSPGRPVSIAVLGPPGSGKSFAARQIKNAVSDHRQLDMLEFNLSQMTAYSDLVTAFHRIRDAHLLGKVPFVFLDEFDAPLQGKPLGWLRMLLAPMQDGVFRDAGGDHPLGTPLVLVMAGSTAHRYADFLKDSPAFVLAKGPDFASRLRGRIDVLGPDPTGLDDCAYPLRRAVLIRQLLENRSDAQQLFAPGDPPELQVDPGVLRALLHTRRYHHGARSVEAVLDMSQLAHRTQYDRAALPPPDQLELHADWHELQWLAASERFCSMLDWPLLVTVRDRLVGTVLEEDRDHTLWHVDGVLRAEAGRAGRPQGAKTDGNPTSLLAVENLIVQYAARLFHHEVAQDPTPWEALSRSRQQALLDMSARIPRVLRALELYFAPLDDGSGLPEPPMAELASRCGVSNGTLDPVLAGLGLQVRRLRPPTSGKAATPVVPIRPPGLRREPSGAA